MLTLVYIILGLISIVNLLASILYPFYYKWGKFKFLFHTLLCHHMPDKDNPGKCKICGKDTERFIRKGE